MLFTFTILYALYFLNMSNRTTDRIRDNSDTVKIKSIDPQMGKLLCKYASHVAILKQLNLVNGRLNIKVKYHSSCLHTAFTAQLMLLFDLI